MNVPAASPLKPRRSIPVLLMGGGLLLACGLALEMLPFRDVRLGNAISARGTNHLARLLPERIPGWTCRNEPLGPTEFTTKAARNVLNFDDYLFRSYTRPGQSFTVYVAYWRPGSMPVQLVAGHTPDACWTGAGWTREEGKAAEVLRAGPIILRPAQWRKMSFPGKKGVQYVAFWHLVGGRLYVASEYLTSIPSPWAYWREAMHYALGGRREQYAVRLTASVPFSELETDPGYEEILHALARLGLAESGASSPAE